MNWSKKLCLDWVFFLGENDWRQYNKRYKVRVHPYEQSFRVVVVSCLHYLYLRFQKCGN